MALNETLSNIRAIPVLYMILLIFLVLVLVLILVIRLKIHPYTKTSLIMACLFWLPALNFITNALAIIFGILALKAVQSPKEKACAIIGIVVGAVTLIISII